MATRTETAAAQEGRRGELLAAAIEILDERGPHGLNLRDVADRAGTSTQAVYTEFGGKAGLIDELFAFGFRRLEEAFAAVPETSDPIERLRALGRAYWRRAMDGPAFYALMFGRPIKGYEPTPSSQQIAWGTFQPLLAAVDVAVEHLSGDAQDVPAIATTLWAANHGLVSLQLAGHVNVGEELIDDGVDAIVHGYAKRASSRSNG